MKLLCICLFIYPYLILAQSNTSVNSPKAFRRYSSQYFLQSGYDITKHQQDTIKSILEINKAERQFRISKGLLGGGIASCVIGTASLSIVALQSSSKNTITPQSTPYLITGVAFNLISMPTCFVIREILLKKAARHIQKAKQLIAQ